jgi:orotidine-5'-phosphate decarboxylase
MINIAPDTTAVDADRTGRRVNRCAAQAAEVDDEGIVPDPETATMVTTATDGERQYVVPCVRHAGDHVGHVGTPHDRERTSIYCAVVDGSRGVILRIRGGDDHASDSGKII